jgi:hypothetical protein
METPMKCTSLIVVVLVALLSLARSASTAPVPGFSMSEIVARADVIVVGTVVTKTDSGVSAVATADGVPLGRSVTVDLDVDRVLKGDPVSSVRMMLTVPDLPRGFGTVDQGDYRVFFLSKKGDDYEPTSPYYPSVPAAPVRTSSARTALDRVAEVVGAALSDPGVDTNVKIQAVAALRGVRNEFATAALRQSLGSVRRDIRLSAAASLLASGDLEALAAAEPVLMSQDSSAESFLFGLTEGVRDERAVPVLSRLLKAPNAKIRQATAHALRNIKSATSSRALVRALDDDDVMVKYDAVLGLAEFTGQSQWGPSVPAFQENPNRYIEHWKEWAKSSR